MESHTHTLYTPRTATITNRLDTPGAGKGTPYRDAWPHAVLVPAPNAF